MEGFNVSLQNFEKANKFARRFTSSPNARGSRLGFAASAAFTRHGAIGGFFANGLDRGFSEPLSLLSHSATDLESFDALLTSIWGLGGVRGRRVVGVVNFVHAQKKKLEGELKRVKKENEERSSGIFGWDSRVDGLG
ncbi:hypothetical protein Sjap_017450 [Stephania japonica]|uniref:Uncharacterized protein n=1 Tax=Stephania japonica TaxID=461633 RepID=A0AAP0NKD6_9MAGN